MRATHREPRFLLLLLLLLLTFLLAPTALAFSLADIQQISGFGTACTNAYSTPFTNCTYDDFYGPQGCSTACAGSLGALLANIDESCNGHTAFPTTLIGLIFSGDAFSTLCPGSSGSAGGSGSPVGGAGGGGSDNGNANGKSSVHIPLPTDGVASQSPTTLTAPNVSPTSTSSFGLHSYLTPILATSSTTSLNEPLASSTLSPASTTITSLSAFSSTALQISTSTSTSTVPLSDLTRVDSTPTTTKEAAAKSSSTTSSSSTSQQTNNPQGAGGGTPFDITSASCRSRRNAWWTIPVPTAIFVLLWLV